MAWSELFPFEEEDLPYWGKLGWQFRARFVVRRTRRVLKRRRRRGVKIYGYSPSTHRRSEQVGPIPLAVKMKRSHRRWR